MARILSAISERVIQGLCVVFALALSYGAAWLAAEIILPASVDVEAELRSVPFVWKVMHAAAVLAVFCALFVALYVAGIIAGVLRGGD